jgi:UDP-N-acetylmuramate dehydrogenase
MNFNFNNLQSELRAAFGDERIRINEALARHCNWRVGGPADLFFAARTVGELARALRICHGDGLTPTIIGFGANSLVSDKGVRGLVILNRAHRISFRDDSVVAADSGTNLVMLAKEAATHGVSGLEFLIGIPGTVGAAVAVNAGTRTEWISELVERVQIFDRSGATVWVQPADLEFSYRHSRLKITGEVVLAAIFRGIAGEPAQIEKRMTEYLQVRKNQPSGPSAGSVFKNPGGEFAGRLIEASGLKGYQLGGAQISPMHANFIINVGNARAQDIKEIIERVKTEVESKFGVTLEEEIRYLGEW